MTVADPFIDIPQAVRERWEAQIEIGGDGGAAITSRYPNDNRPDPDSGPWARVTVREGRRVQADFGGGTTRSRTPGVFYADLFGDAQAGAASLTAIAKRVRVAFDRQTIDGVTFRTAFLPNGSTGDRVGKWYRVTVAVPFYADDIQ